VGLPRGYFLDEATAAVRAALETTAAAQSSIGASVREIELPSMRHVPLTLLGLQSETQPYLLPLALEHPDGFASRDIRNRIIANEFVRLADARRALRLRDRIRQEVASAMSDLDLLLTPTNSTPPFPIGAEAVAIGTGEETVALSARGGQSRITTRLTIPFNVVGLPAVSLPAGDLAEGLPIGVQLVAAEWQEPLLLRAALALEAATSGGYREPPLVGQADASRGRDLTPVAALGATR
jgi:aspartyl-tRNA(Asn)/glutamyl-tRNA(Gln) amidotransferase subunit A